ncbi:MAG: 1-acyl-sn-glycerol-3-phosphate acyltransferase, partial [Burkholderiales bacterium]
SGRKVEIGLVPFGSIGMTVFAVDLWFASRSMASTGLRGLGVFLADHANWRIMADLFLLAMFSGFYSVPLYALIQSRCEPSYRARIIAANNILNALFMVVASVMAAALLHEGLTLPQLYMVVGVLNAAVAVYIYTLVPEFLVRFIAWLLIHSVYRLEQKDLERIPDEGPALIVCNHISFVDPVVIFAACRQPVRFVMDYRIFETPILSFVFRTVRAIPIASAKEDPAMMERAFADVATALAAGEIVMIFPEGSLTKDGELQRFRPGVTRILEANPVPVIPMALSGLWGSFFSRKDGPVMSKPWRLVPFRKIALSVGPAVPAAQATPELLHARVLELRGDWK